MNTSERPTLRMGLQHREEMTVQARHTVPQVEPAWPGFADMPPVFATAMMVALMEQTCIMGLRPYLQPGQHTVGTQVDMSHVAATPVGMQVWAEVELIGIEGRALHFKVACHDASGLIGEGTHRRAIIDVPKFMQRLAQKAGSAA